jgi:hypothetical protein
MPQPTKWRGRPKITPELLNQTVALIDLERERAKLVLDALEDTSEAHRAYLLAYLNLLSEEAPTDDAALEPRQRALKEAVHHPGLETPSAKRAKEIVKLTGRCDSAMLDWLVKQPELPLRVRGYEGRYKATDDPVAQAAALDAMYHDLLLRSDTMYPYNTMYNGMQPLMNERIDSNEGARRWEAVIVSVLDDVLEVAENGRAEVVLYRPHLLGYLIDYLRASQRQPYRDRVIALIPELNDEQLKSPMGQRLVSVMDYGKHLEAAQAKRDADRREISALPSLESRLTVDVVHQFNVPQENTRLAYAQWSPIKVDGHMQPRFLVFYRGNGRRPIPEQPIQCESWIGIVQPNLQTDRIVGYDTIAAPSDTDIQIFDLGEGCLMVEPSLGRVYWVDEQGFTPRLTGGPDEAANQCAYLPGEKVGYLALGGNLYAVDTRTGELDLKLSARSADARRNFEGKGIGNILDLYDTKDDGLILFFRQGLNYFSPASVWRYQPRTGQLIKLLDNEDGIRLYPQKEGGWYLNYRVGGKAGQSYTISAEGKVTPTDSPPSHEIDLPGHGVRVYIHDGTGGNDAIFLEEPARNRRERVGGDRTDSVIREVAKVVTLNTSAYRLGEDYYVIGSPGSGTYRVLRMRIDAAP